MISLSDCVAKWMGLGKYNEPHNTARGCGYYYKNMVLRFGQAAVDEEVARRRLGKN